MNNRNDELYDQLYWRNGVPARPRGAAEAQKPLPGYKPSGWLAKLFPEGVPAPAPVAPAPVFKRGKLVFALDATASRSEDWKAKTQLTDTMFHAMPGELEIALACHGGGRVHTFTDFVRDARRLRKLAGGVECISGSTQFVPILQRVSETEGVGVVVYIGDAFEESASAARWLSAVLKAQGTRLIVLFEGFDPYAENIYADLTARTGGALLPFDLSSLGKLKELLAAVAVLAVGGVELLEDKRATMPGAVLLLEHLGKRGPS